MLIEREELQAIIDELAEGGFKAQVSGEVLRAIAEAAEGSFAFCDAYWAICAPLTAAEAEAAGEVLRGAASSTPADMASQLWDTIVAWRVEGASARGRPT